MAALSRVVPQGSVLGPLLYSVFTNELSEVACDPACRNLVYQNPVKLFSDFCQNCGGIVQYANDMTYMISNRTRIPNQYKLVRNLEELQDFLSSNWLAINKGKTKLTECMISQKRAKTVGLPPNLDIINNKNEPETISDSKICRIL